MFQSSSFFLALTIGAATDILREICQGCACTTILLSRLHSVGLFLYTSRLVFSQNSSRMDSSSPELSILLCEEHNGVKQICPDKFLSVIYQDLPLKNKCIQPQNSGLVLCLRSHPSYPCTCGLDLFDEFLKHMLTFIVTHIFTDVFIGQHLFTFEFYDF